MNPSGFETPASMRIARLYAWGDVRLEAMPTPVPGPGEALVRVEACGVCGSDALGWYVEQKAPVVLGHEPAGTVVALGQGVAHLRVGDRVFVHHHAPCGRCANCRRRLWSNCATWRAGRLTPGGFAEYACASPPIVARDVLRLPDALGWDLATFIEPVACCLRALRRAQVRNGDVVLVIGLGAMGLTIQRLARSAGAGLVAGSDPVAERRDHALRAGADLTLDPQTQDVVNDLLAATGGRGADVVVVTPGSADAVRAGLDAAAPGGRVVCFTPLPPHAPLQIEPSALYFREVSLSHSYSCGPDETRSAMRLLASGRLQLDDLITARGGLADVGRALERAKEPGAHIKSIIRPGD